MTGRVLGLDLWIEEVVTAYEPPRRKVWETRGEPRLLVIDRYRMGFTIDPAARGSRLAVFIDYRRPRQGVGRVLGPLLGRSYAAWWTRRIVQDARATFCARAQARA